MKWLLGFALAIVIAVILVPAALAANPPPDNGRVLIAAEGDITLPSGERADLVMVVNGTATILGEVDTVIAVDGRADLIGARAEAVIAIRSPVELGPGTVVLGDVMTLDSAVHRTGNAELQGNVTDLAGVLVGLGVALAPAFVLFWIGFGLALIVAGVLLAGLAARQVREAEAVISKRPAGSLVAGIGGLLIFPLVALVLIATLVGAPLGIGILLQLWPLVAFIGYLVAGIWIGDWILRRTTAERDREKPYVAAILGLVLLGLLSLVPVLSLVVAIASLVGFGAVLLLSVEKLRTPPTRRPMTEALPAPIPS